jgi:hypothetical protein
MNLYVNSNLNKNIIKFKITILLDSLDDYMILILKNVYIRNWIMEQ